MTIAPQELMKAVEAYDARLLAATDDFLVHHDPARLAGGYLDGLETEAAAAGISTRLLSAAHRAYSARH